MLTLHSKHKSNRVTVVGDVVDGKLLLSASRCSKKDSFVRKIGNAIATGRFNAGKYCRTIDVGSDFNTTIFVELASDFAEDAHAKGSLICTKNKK